VPLRTCALSCSPQVLPCCNLLAPRVRPLLPRPRALQRFTLCHGATHDWAFLSVRAVHGSRWRIAHSQLAVLSWQAVRGPSRPPLWVTPECAPVDHSQRHLRALVYAGLQWLSELSGCPFGAARGCASTRIPGRRGRAGGGRIVNAERCPVRLRLRPGTCFDKAASPG